MKDRNRPIVRMAREKMPVRRACDGEIFFIARAITFPEEAATMRVTTGRSQTANILSKDCVWRVCLRWG